jgi:hypothetical protein
MNHHHIPLATASLLFVIARPAMAVSGVTIVQSIGYAGPILAALGIGLIVVNHSNLHSSEEIYLDILRVGQFLLIAGAAASMVLFLYYSLSANP